MLKTVTSMNPTAAFRQLERLYQYSIQQVNHSRSNLTLFCPPSSVIHPLACLLEAYHKTNKQKKRFICQQQYNKDGMLLADVSLVWDPLIRHPDCAFFLSGIQKLYSVLLCLIAQI